LRRIEFAGACYSTVIDKCKELWNEKYVAGNLYHGHHVVFRQYAQIYKLSMQNELPVVQEEFLKNLSLNRVNFKDQWASHPSLEEREENLKQLAVPAETASESAWVLFDDRESWQQLLTEKVYGGGKQAEDVQTVDRNEFEILLQQDNQLYTLPEVYKGFYDRRLITKLNIPELSFGVNTTHADLMPFEKIFNETNGALHKKITGLENDIQVLNSIAEKQIRTKTFDFDGKKYKAIEAKPIAENLQQEVKEMKEQLENLDKDAYRYFYRKALLADPDKAAQLKENYKIYFAGREQTDLYLTNVNNILEDLQPIYSGGRITIEQAHQIIGRVKSMERHLKAHLNNWLTDGAFERRPVFKQQVMAFIKSDFEYFTGQGFVNEELNILNQAINEGWRSINAFLFRKFKDLLEMQVATN
jgi:hypothetical protein